MKNKQDYWYKQSSVIPYRIVGKKIEVLIITTRKRKKWTFPKGIVELNLSARESALKEAIEEAGVNGKLLPQKLGKYSYKKWGGKCRVKTYGLEVETINEIWEENFRERKWIVITEAEKHITNKKVLEILRTLEKSI